MFHIARSSFKDLLIKPPFNYDINVPSLVTLKFREGPLAALVSAWNHNEDLMDRQGVRAAPVPLAVVDGDDLVLGHLLPRPHLEHLPQLHRAH